MKKFFNLFKKKLNKDPTSVVISGFGKKLQNEEKRFLAIKKGIPKCLGKYIRSSRIDKKIFDIQDILASVVKDSFEKRNFRKVKTLIDFTIPVVKFGELKELLLQLEKFSVDVNEDKKSSFNTLHYAKILKSEVDRLISKRQKQFGKENPVLDIYINRFKDAQNQLEKGEKRLFHKKHPDYSVYNIFVPVIWEFEIIKRRLKNLSFDKKDSFCEDKLSNVR